MKLIIDNTRSVLTDLTQSERNDIKSFLSKKDPRSGFVRGKFKADRVKTEKFYFENKVGILFFTGLLPDLQPFIKSRITSVENRVVQFPYQREYTYEELRPYFNPKFEHVEHQIRALQEMLKRTKGTIKAVTSSGKTELFLAFCKITGLKTLIVAPKVDLANQICDRARNYGLEVGLMTGSKKSYDSEQVCVSTPQMALALVDREFDCIIIDECHHAASKTYQDFLKNTKAKIIFGFSATPDTNDVDWMKIKQFCGGIITEIKAAELLEHNVIVYPEINFVPIKQFNTPDWPSANDVCIVHNEDRNLKIVELCEKSEKPVLVLIRNIEHGEELNRLISDSVFLSGRDDGGIRDEVFKKYENKEIPVLIGSYGILSEGISLNSIRTLIIAGGGRSDIQATQALGRALRNQEGKIKATVFDFYDFGNKFCERHSLQRAKIYKQVGFPSEIIKDNNVDRNLQK